MTAIAMTSPVRHQAARPAVRNAARPESGRAGRARVTLIQTPAARARRRTFLVLVALGLAAVVGPQAFANDGDAAPVVLDTYTVSPGETLWSIAASLAPAGVDVRDVIADIRTVNAMGDASLQAGEQILLPQVG